MKSRFARPPVLSSAINTCDKPAKKKNRWDIHPESSKILAHRQPSPPPFLTPLSITTPSLLRDPSSPPHNTMPPTTALLTPPPTPATCTCQLHINQSPLSDCLRRRALLCIIRKLPAFSTYLKTQTLAGHGSDPVVHRANVLFRCLATTLTAVYNCLYWKRSSDGLFKILPASDRIPQLVEAAAKAVGSSDNAEMCKIVMC